MLSLSAEPQRAVMRLYVPGGRMRESKKQPGAVLVGSRTIQEGGAFLDMTREDVELFCIDHLLMVDIIATEEALMFDVRIIFITILVSSFMNLTKTLFSDGSFKP